MTPPFAPTIYHDGASLFLTLPGTPGQCLRFPFTEAGLSKALRHVPNIAKQPGYVSGASNFTPPASADQSSADRFRKSKIKIAKVTERARERATFSTDMREAARAVVRKLKTGR